MFVGRYALYAKRQSVHQSFREQYDSRRADARRDASPLAQGVPAASETRTASLSKPQAVGGSAAGWTAAGGSPIVVANGETLDTISGRYGVPAAALLSANGLSNASEVKSGTHLVVPVYHADGHAVAGAESEKTAKKRDKDVADADVSKSAKTKKDKEKEKAAKAERQGSGEVCVKGREGG